MGRRSNYPENHNAPIKLRLVRLRMVDLCYDQGGAYWGMGTPLYWAHGESEDADIFLRAQNRESAKELIREKLPNARFYR